MDGDASERTGRRYDFYLGAVLVALFFLRVLGEPWDTHFPPPFGGALRSGRLDTPDTYLALASLGPFRWGFFWGESAVAYPAYLWVLARSFHVVVLAQIATYCAAFGFLWVVARQVLRTRWIAIAVTVVVVLIAVQGRFAVWNTQLLSESLDISLGIVAIAMWWRVTAAPSPQGVTWAWFWTIAWVLVRDTHAVPVVIGVVPIAAGVGWLAKSLTPDVRRRLLIGAAIALVVCGYVYASQEVSGRNRYALYSNIGMRVLPNPELRAWFVRGGMPLDAALLGREGKSAFDDRGFFIRDRSLARFRAWADADGTRRMALSLVVRAPDWCDLLGKQWDRILGYAYEGYDSYGVLERLPRRAPFHLGGPGTARGLFLLLVVAGLLSFLAAIRSLWSGTLKFAVGGVLIVLVDVYTSFVADPLEVERSLAGPLVRLTVMLLVCMAVAMDTLGRRSPAVTATNRGGDVGSPGAC